MHTESYSCSLYAADIVSVSVFLWSNSVPWCRRATRSEESAVAPASKVHSTDALRLALASAVVASCFMSVLIQ